MTTIQDEAKKIQTKAAGWKTNSLVVAAFGTWVTMTGEDPNGWSLENMSAVEMVGAIAILAVATIRATFVRILGEKK